MSLSTVVTNWLSLRASREVGMYSQEQVNLLSTTSRVFIVHKGRKRDGVRCAASDDKVNDKIYVRSEAHETGMKQEWKGNEK